MPWAAIFAVVALLGFQLAVVAASLYAYNRIRSQQDSQGQQREAWSAKLELAVTNADSAKRMVEQVEVDHFKKLRGLYDVQAAELAEAKARITSLERELKVCQMKLASEERINRRDEKRRQKEEAGDVLPEAGGPAGAGTPDVDGLLHQFGHRLNGDSLVPAARPSTFGKMPKPKG